MSWTFLLTGLSYMHIKPNVPVCFRKYDHHIYGAACLPLGDQALSFLAGRGQWLTAQSGAERWGLFSEAGRRGLRASLRL